MKINELRIGNLVLCEGEVAEIKVLDGRTNDVLVHIGERERCGNVDKLQPIPLTHRVMFEACGFITKHGEVTHPVLDDYYFCSLGLSEWHMINDCGDSAYETVQAIFTTLHDLQNYYFVFDGNELPIDLDKLKQSINQ